VNIYNNTFDGAGKCTVPIGGDVVLHGAVVSSLRSNAFVGTRVVPAGGTSFVHGMDSALTPPLPTGLGYSDYNLFYNPDSQVTVIYGAGVQGKSARTDPGFGFHDAMSGGVVNQQVDPKFAVAMPPRTFPFKESDVIAHTTTVCQVLAYYRQIYSPGTGSPLLGAGDPADGAGNNIGAIGAGQANDLFGKLCDPTDIGAPDTSSDVSTCTPMGGGMGGAGVGGAGGTGAGGSGGSGAGGKGTGGTGGNTGFACICTVDPASSPGSDLGALAAMGAAAAVVLGTRRRRRRR
jgi:MYXO-CTERM domain-containing protein